MKRLLALMLCVAMLACLLVACNNEPAKNPQDTTKPTNESENSIKLTQYTIIYPSRASNVVRDAALSLAATIQPLIEDEVKITTDEASISADPDAKEILIGSTMREASTTYYKATPSFKFNVYQDGNKIVLAGYTDALVAKAVSYFAEEYVNHAEDGIIQKVTDYEGTFDKMLTLTEAKSSNFRVAYQKTDSLQIPYIGDVVNSVVEKIKGKTEVLLPSAYASPTYSGTRKEILVGRFSHSALSNAYDELKLGGYLISVLENKILIAATSKDSYKDSIAALDGLLTSNMLYGTKNVAIEVGATSSDVGSALMQKLPVASLSPTDIVPAGNNCQLAIFEGATKSFFNEYVGKLKEAGFVEHSRTNFDGTAVDKKNSFGTYVTDDCFVDLGFHENVDRMYLSVSPRDELTIPATEIPEYTPVDSTQYPVTMTQVGTYEFHPREHAMCYIMRLADGSFIIYDTSYGSYRPQGSLKSKQVAEEIYEILKKQAPNPNNIVVSAIFITHPHTDHMGGLLQFADRYASNPAIKVKQFVYNFPDLSACPNASEATNVRDTTNIIKKFGAKLEVIKPRTGNVLYYPGMKFNVLYTQEDYMAVQTSFGYGNTSSFVMQMITDGGVKVVIGGDHSVDGRWEGNEFCKGAIHKWYGDFIKSDIVTLFHHGLGGGADDTVYTVIKPKVILWPGTWFRIEKQDNGQYYDTKLYDVGYNKYFTKQQNGTVFEPDVWHDTPNHNGVHAWYVSDDGIQVVTFIDDRFAVAHYGTRAEYFAS